MRACKRSSVDTRPGEGRCQSPRQTIPRHCNRTAWRTRQYRFRSGADRGAAGSKRFPTRSGSCAFAPRLSSASINSSATRSSSITARHTASKPCGGSPAAAASTSTKGKSAGNSSSIAQLWGRTDLAEVTRRICEAAALGLQKLGVPARYRPRNDIEVDGRKISGTGGFFDGNLIFYQGTLLIDFDPAKMLACLNVPAEKLAKRGIDSAGAARYHDARSSGRRLARSRNHLATALSPALPRVSASPPNGDRSRLMRKNWPSVLFARRSAPMPMSQCWTRRRLTMRWSAHR